MPGIPPKLKMSPAPEPLSPSVLSSRNFRICSASILELTCRTTSINAVNCSTPNRGPKLILQRHGRISMATTSLSHVLPMTLNTSSAAILTAGSLVLIPRNSGISFSWMVAAAAGEQSTLNASSPRILIPRDEVFVNTAATAGNTSFFRVGKSSFGRSVGMERRARSCKA
ncbi:unnamed protein product [Tuber aestivum]|uniref:Uncharacterized protein n=1 Tax=Tuber aestivum TaxID=59557 RepID=A0A292PI97_9PEZI|nr:unnamed protein product [Tuber aestivum]